MQLRGELLDTAVEVSLVERGAGIGRTAVHELACRGRLRGSLTGRRRRDALESSKRVLIGRFPAPACRYGGHRVETAASESWLRLRTMRVAVTGATGFVGAAVAKALSDDGHDVTALTRHPDEYHGAGRAVHADIGEAQSLRRALDGQEVAYYLVHSLAVEDFAVRDRVGAAAFAAAATGAGLSQVVYLGGLGDDRDELSAHLRSRREVESILRDGAPTTALRAGIVIGDGSISWEILRQLVERLPVMITPRWVQTKTQPIALDDALIDLVGVLGRPETIGEVYDIGGPEVLTYLDMMVIASRVMERHRVIVAVPLLSPRLSSHWLRLITDVDLTTARALVDSLTNEVVVRDRRLDELLGHTPMMFAEAAAKALAVRVARRAAAEVRARP